MKRHYAMNTTFSDLSSTDATHASGDGIDMSTGVTHAGGDGIDMATGVVVVAVLVILSASVVSWMSRYAWYFSS